MASDLGGTATSPVVIYYSFLPHSKMSAFGQIGVPAEWIHNPDYCNDRSYPRQHLPALGWTHLVLILSYLFWILCHGLRAFYDWNRRLPLERGLIFTFAPVLARLFSPFGLSGIINLGWERFFTLPRWLDMDKQCDVGGNVATRFVWYAIAVGSWFAKMRVPRTLSVFSAAPSSCVQFYDFGVSYFSYYKWEYSFFRSRLISAGTPFSICSE